MLARRSVSRGTLEPHNPAYGGCKLGPCPCGNGSSGCPGEHATALVYREHYPRRHFAGVTKTIVLTEDDADFSSPSIAGDAGVLIAITDRAGGAFDLALVPEQLLGVEVRRYADASCDGSIRAVDGEDLSLETSVLLDGASYSCRPATQTRIFSGCGQEIPIG